MSATSFITLLNSYKVVAPGVVPNIVGLPPNQGKWQIPADEYHSFLETYAKAVYKGGEYQFVEVQEPIRPFVVDIDLKHPLAADGRVYTDDDVFIIVQLFIDQIKHYFDIESFDCYVFEKKEPKKMTNIYKDGIHLIFPTVIGKQPVQLEIRENIVHHIKSNKTLEHLQLENTIDDVFDECIYKRTGWMLYGSCKPGSFPYELSKIVTQDGTLKPIPRKSFAEWVKYFSVRGKEEEDLLPLKVEPTRGINNQSNTNRAAPVENDRGDDVVSLLVDILSKERADNRDSWIDVGICLFNIDENNLELWKHFSKKSLKYVEGECENIWNTFNPRSPNKLTVATLNYWAHHDNPIEYRNIKRIEISNAQEIALECTHTDVANVMYTKYGHQYKCADIDKKVWYVFENHKWCEVPKGFSLRSKLSDDLVNDFHKLAQKYKLLAMSSEDQSEINKGRVKSCNELIRKLKDVNFKHSVMTECEFKFYDENFVKRLDSNKQLVCFTNGVFDLDKMRLREGRPEDYISLSMDAVFEPYEDLRETTEAVQMLDFLRKVLPKEEVRRYILKHISTFLSGKTDEQKFPIWTGSGSNGKSQLVKLIEITFDKYFHKLPSSVLTQKRPPSSSATPEISLLVGKRFVSFAETEKTDKLQVGYMKELSGGDTIMARPLYGKPFNFKPQFKMLLMCNELPYVDANDGGTWRRLRICDFPSKFVDNPDPSVENEYLKDNDIPNKLSSWRHVFASLLIQMYALYKKDGLMEPDSVMYHTREYQKKSDLYQDFIEDNIECTDGPKDNLLINILYTRFKAWHQEAYCTLAPSRTIFKSEFEKKFGPPHKTQGWKGLKLKPLISITQEDDEEDL